MKQQKRTHRNSRKTLALASERALAISMFEPLEQRQHLSSTMVGDQLVVQTGAGNDTVLVQPTLNGKQIVIVENGTTFTFPSAAIARVQVLTGAGNDTITIASIGFVASPKTLIVGGAGNDTITGGNNADEIYADNVRGRFEQARVAGDNVVRGGLGNDTVVGGNGRDTLLGELGDDSLLAGAGDDSLDGGAGNDTLDGENGSDVITCGAANDGADVMYGGGGDTETMRFFDYLDYSKRTNGVRVEPSGLALGGEVGEGDRTFADFEYIFGGSGNDTLYGSDGYNQIRGYDGHDFIAGGGGDDYLVGGNGNDAVFGDAGNDHIEGNAGNNQLFGGDDDDSIWGGTLSDTINGGDGLDYTGYDDRTTTLSIWLDGSNPSGAVQLGENDRLASIEWVSGGWGSDSIYGNNDANRLNGGPGGDDFIRGFGGNDLIVGSNFGNCMMYGDDGDDIIDGQVGNDHLIGGRGNDLLRGFGGLDTLFGSQGDDSLEGGNGDDVLWGSTGSDTLKGENGNDVLYGDDDNGEPDVLNGGDGTDGYRADGLDQLIDLEILL